MSYDIIITGAGAVGLATAYQLIKKYPALKIAILEKEQEVAKHQTGNNSGVIHSGIYYKPGSLKAKNCILGYDLLIQFANENDIPYEICGKVIVATSESEFLALDKIYQNGTGSGLKGLKYINPVEIKEHEPHANGLKGIFVPQTGIIDYKQVAIKLADCLIHLGVEIHFSNEVLSIEEDKSRNEFVIETNQQSIKSNFIINCSGLYSDKLLEMTKDLRIFKNSDGNDLEDFKIIPFRGEYYKLKKESEYLVKTLIYPVPDPDFPFLGVHFTKMMRGGVEAGPNAVLAYQREGYNKSDINLKELIETLTFKGFQKIALKYMKTGIGEIYRSYSKPAFTHALQKLIPEITSNDLIPGGSGVRAQACTVSGKLIDDFYIAKAKGIINVCNAPSPAATSCLSIGLSILELYEQNSK